jgi:two-component system, cell cycle response regulator
VTAHGSTLAGGTPERLRLLLAEDDPFQKKILERILTRAGYAVETATSGEEALARVQDGRFQILITDWDMPGMDGAALCRRIREAQLPGYLYILLLTAHAAVSHTVTGLEAGADDYVRKPADEGELLARVKAGARIVELERSLSAANARVERLSLIDALLGCYNRRYLNEQLPREIERARRYDTRLSLVMADLDAFKQINDVHGHTVGDEVLVGFAQRATACLRQAGDWIARFGGEEFAIVLPHADLANASSVAERIRTECTSTPVLTTVAPLNVTVSLGVAALKPAADVKAAMASLLARADSALYQSKRDGRDRVTLANT